MSCPLLPKKNPVEGFADYDRKSDPTGKKFRTSKLYDEENGEKGEKPFGPTAVEMRELWSARKAARIKNWKIRNSGVESDYSA